MLLELSGTAQNPYVAFVGIKELVTFRAELSSCTLCDFVYKLAD